ncbi:MAG: SNF2-related protein, partial [Methylococcales bacterium]
MSKSKKLLSADIRYGCSDSSYERGKRYYENGQVLDLNTQSEGALFVQLNASVKGSVNIPYKQNIRIIWRPDFSSAEIIGNCSCPVGFNCKHVAAVCMKYRNPNLSPVKTKAGPSCLDWLQDFDKQNKTVAQDLFQEFIAYVLVPGKNAHEFSINLLITKAKKTGGYGKGRKTNLTNLRYSYSYLNYVREDDQEIGKLLTVLNPVFKDEPIISGATGFLALTKLLKSGRLFWLNTDQEPLQTGEQRAVDFSWQTAKNGDFQLAVHVEPQAQIMLTDPPQYLDTLTGSIGALDTQRLNLEQFKKLLTAPLIPARMADEFSQRLIIDHPGLSLPAPKKIDLVDIQDLVPVPRLFLCGDEIAQHYLHLMKVSFDYGDWPVSAYEPKPYAVIAGEQGLVRIRRSAELEQAAIAAVTAWGFTPVTGNDPGRAELLLYSPVEKSTIDSAARWSDFLEYGVPELQSQGWLVDIGDSFLLSFANAENWDAEITSSQNDWFEMHFTVDVDGQSVPLLPLIMPVLENYDIEDLPVMLSLPMANHKYLNLPSEKIKPFLAILLELFNSSSLNDYGSLRLSRFNVATLADLEEHSHGLFSLSGGEALRELGQKLKNFTGIAEVPLPDNFHAQLRTYQQQGLNWLQFLREYKFSGILADDMGLGKTVQTLVHLLVEKQSGRMTNPTLIIAPTSLMSNWRREAERFTPDLQVLILQGTERKQQFDKIKDFDLILTTYPLLPRDELILLEYDYHYLVLDEAQTIKNPLSKAAKLVRKISAEHRLCLTGTPMENHLGELWAQFDFLMPGFLSDSSTFKKIYRTPIEMHGDNQQRLRLSKRIAPFMLRRSKQDVVKELPAKTEIIRSVPLYEKQAALYESIRLTMEKKVRDAIAEKGLSRSHITILDALLKLRQTCCDPRTLPLKEAQKISASAKLDLLLEMVPELLEEGRRILIFSQFTRMISLIEKELSSRKLNYAKLTGQTRNRDEAIDLFKSGQVDVFLISLKAGGVGLNLTEADTVIIYDPWWNPAVENQAADRAHRIGQDKPVFIYKLITENTVEEKILAMQDRKRALAEGIYQNSDQEEPLK